MKDEERYCGCMEDVLRRLALVEAISCRKVATGNELFDGELAFLQLRKIAELIVFGSLIANKAAYSAENPKFSEHWRAKELMCALEKLNPNFYPLALCPPIRQPNGIRHFELVTDGYLTRDECGFLYDQSSEIIHSRNPFTTKPNSIDVRYSGPDWIARIRNLLAWHRIQLVGGTVWLVNAAQSPARVYPATPD